MQNTNNFDEKAIFWDSNPKRIEYSQLLANKIKDFIRLEYKGSYQALEYGSATGLMAVLLADYFKEITLMDSSPKMLELLAEKIKAQRLNNLHPLYYDLQHQPSAIQVNLIYTVMTLHHIEDTALILRRFFPMLIPPGFLIIVDLMPEDGSFHQGAVMPHCGFDPDKLQELARAEGYKVLEFNPQIYTLEKEERNYDFFLLILQKVG
jgi:ubiquinone/menaquinone biosynthesis C-methylase UbiE